MNIDQLIADVRKLAAKKPDNVYTKGLNRAHCSYIEGKSSDGEHGCIFGQAGKNQPDLYEYMNRNRDTSISAILIDFEIKDTDKINWCGRVQSRQDRGNKWKECIEYADMHVKRDK